MKCLLTLLFTLWLAACTFTPPKPTSYEDAPRVPINKTVPVSPVTAS